MLKERMAEIADAEDEPEEGEEGWRPKTRSAEGFTPVLGALYTAIEAINEVSRTLIAVNNRKPPPAQKIPRPVSALDLLDLYEERDEMAELATRFNVGANRSVE